MKRMIISPAQLKAINESMNYGGQILPNETSASLSQKANDFFAGNAGATSVQFVNPDGNGQSVVGDVNDTNIDTKSSNIVFQKQQNESRYSKRQVELGRMLEMRKSGKVFSKKQLNEMFMETQENADRLRQGIGGCRLHDIFAAIEEFFPEEVDGVKEAFMNGADLPEYICSIFGNDGINGEKEQAFLERLGI
jgi:hypothetical protein